MNDRTHQDRIAGVSRRDWLRLSTAGVVATSSSGWLGQIASAAETSRRPAKSCILLWMNGGPSQHHTFSPAREGNEFKTISTSVSGIEVCDTLPKVSQHMQDIALLRSMTTPEQEHERARSLMHDGYRPIPGETFPALGSIAAKELGRADAELPNFVMLDGGRHGGDGPGFYRPIPAYLGPKYGPLVVPDPARGVENLRSARSATEFDADLARLQTANQKFLAEHPLDAARARESAIGQAVRLMRTPTAKAFDLDREPLAMREAYGSTKFGKACLVARRLIEAEVPFVEVWLRGWDDHSGAAKPVIERMAYVDPILATLLGDLKQRGLLDSTLVVWMGEFGRSPGKGEGHFSDAWTTVLAGGGLKTGQVIGKTDAKGRKVEERPITAPDFMATVCQTLGIDHTQEYHTRDDRPIRIAEKGATPVAELFG